MTGLRPPCDEALLRASPEARQCSQSAGRAVLAAAIIGSSMSFIDGTVVNVALPVLREQLGASLAEAQWIIEAHLLFLASLLLVGGALGDRWGRRRVFIAGAAIFAASSLWCGLARDVTQLIIARGVQGIGAALLVPGSLALISASFDRERLPSPGGASRKVGGRQRPAASTGSARCSPPPVSAVWCSA